MEESPRYGRGQNPKSRQNLLSDQPRLYDEKKSRHTVMVTPTGWLGLRELADSMGISISELIERVGRGELGINTPKD